MPLIELEIDRLAQTGEGVATHEGRAVFVEGAFPGERVRVELSAGKVLRGALREVVRAHPSRRASPCPLSDRCGGCDWIELGEAAQREAKQAIVVSALEHLGRVAPGRYALLPAVAGARAMGHRRRATLHPVKGALGFFGRGTHRVVAVDRCPALSVGLQALLAELPEALAGALGDVEEVSLLESEAAGRRAVALLLKTDRVSAKVSAAAQKLDRLGVAVVAVPKKGPAHVVGDPELPDGPALMRPEAFAQANGELNAKLVDAAVALLPEGARLLELYCGNGNFTFASARRVREVVAVEEAAVSLGLAQKAARAAGVANVRFIQGDALKVTRGFGGSEQFDVLLLDPPRTGAAGVAPLARKLGARRVVYVACDPSALARDAKALIEVGYRPVSVQVFDLFPQTHHVEALMCLDLSEGV